MLERDSAFLGCGAAMASRRPTVEIVTFHVEQLSYCKQHVFHVEQNLDPLSDRENPLICIWQANILQPCQARGKLPMFRPELLRGEQD